ncbi:hypothetical protein HMI54_000208 [Coelomomyces lativittatus]|nr:hypothetical protein HMI54_000208 [Coelomomyces lativittatus]KAJ1514421.1 hypothetical protein HMI56_000492 [Coelomomyces lativittatus]KAJ1514830.1 hypothetical protein HMI55_004302 [Coelomomyces lativittatus]
MKLLQIFHRLFFFKTRTISPGHERKIYANFYPSDKFTVTEKPVYPKFPSNKIVTSKYTLLSFLPKSLFEQFRRLANLFFLLLIILQCFREFMTVDPLIAALPTILIVLATSLKDGFEDLKRHATDKQVNHRRAYTIPNWINVNYSTEHQLDPPKIMKRASFFKRLFHCRRRKRKLKIKEINAEIHTPIDEISEGDQILDAEEAELRQTDPWRSFSWQEVRVGDFILLRKNDIFPADICILSTSEPNGYCYTETKNLDGETNLKLRKGLKDTSFLTTPEDCRCTKMVCTAEPPTNNMFSFHGTIQLDQRDENGNTESQIQVPIDMSNMLLRGCILRNTSWVIGLVIYTGCDTKIKLNSGKTPLKRSFIERKMNFHILINLILISTLCIICAIANSYWNREFSSKKAQFVPFIQESDADIPKNAFFAFWSSLIAFQNIVPISLYLTVEVVKSLQAYFIHLDNELYYEITDSPCTPKSWNLADDLGQVEYVFSDKTGTLTRNVMEFRRCSIYGKIYGAPLESSKFVGIQNTSSEIYVVPKSFVPSSQYASSVPKFFDSRLYEVLHSPNLESSRVSDFWRLIGVCHTVLISQPDPKQPFNVQYKAQSPDEAALVAAAKDVGFTFVGRQETEIFLNVHGVEEKYTLLAILEFNSTRKRMSVIVRKPDNTIVLYCKGADNVIFDRLSDSVDESLKRITLNHLEQFAEEGLRTLCIGYRNLEEEEFQEWLVKYNASCLAIQDREAKLDEAAELIENSLLLLGATAIEDQLQDGVPESIQTLRNAGIKIWVLTGDKMETAISIGFSCNLLSKELDLIQIKEPDHPNEKPVHEQLLEVYKTFFDTSHCQEGSSIQKSEDKENLFSKPADYSFSEHALIIDGVALKSILENNESRSLLLKIGTSCKVVICCRTSPLQKAQVVSLVKDGKMAITCAIGDGANDVSMIQAAHIGVGISGEEGLQAAMASDYAIAQFRYLTKLLLVHGRWSYHRVSELIFNFFYKDLIFVLIIFWYQFYVGYSTLAPYDFTYMLYYNLFFTNWSIAALAVFDQDVPKEIALKAPQLYDTGIKRTYYTTQRFWYFMFEGFYQSLICFFIPIGIYTVGQATHKDGLPGDSLEMGTTMAASAITAANLYIALNTTSFTWLNHVGIWVLSIGVFYGYLFVYFSIPDTPLYGYNSFLWASGYFWFCVCFSIFVCLLPRYIMKYIQRSYYPADRDIALECFKTNQMSEFLSTLLKKEEKQLSIAPSPFITITSPTPIKEIPPSLPIPSVSDEKRKIIRKGIDEIRVETEVSKSSIKEVQPSPHPSVQTPLKPRILTNLMEQRHHRGFSFSTDESGGMRDVLFRDLGSNLHFYGAAIPENPIQRYKSSASDFSVYRPRLSNQKHNRTYSEAASTKAKRLLTPSLPPTLRISTQRSLEQTNPLPIREISALGPNELDKDLPLCSSKAVSIENTRLQSSLNRHSPSPLGRTPRPGYHHRRSLSRLSNAYPTHVSTRHAYESQSAEANGSNKKLKHLRDSEDP